LGRRSTGARCVLARTLIAVVVILSATAATAATYTLTSTAPITNWSDTTRWNGGGGSTYPGQSAGDVVNVGASGFTLNVDVALPAAVQLNVTGTNVAITVPSGSSLVLLNPSSVLASDSVTVNGGTFGVSAGNTVSGWAGPITFNAGSFNGGGSLETSAAVVFHGGTIQNSILTMSAGSSLTIDTSSKGFTIDASTIIVDDGATGTWQGSQPLAMNDGANLGVVGTFNCTGAGNVTESGVVGQLLVRGQFNKTTSSGTIGVATNLILDGGTISSQSGSLQVNYTGQTGLQGTLNTSAGATIDLGGGSSYFTVVNVTGSGKIRFLQGSHNVGNTNFGNIEVDQATLTGDMVFVTGTLDWKGGTIKSNQFTVNGTVNLLGTLGTMSFAGPPAGFGGIFSVGLGGAVNFTSPANPLSIGDFSQFISQGTFTATGDASITGTGKFTNSSVFTKSAGNVTTIACAYTNVSPSTVNVNSGKLVITGGGLDSAMYNVTAASTVEFGGGSRTLNQPLNPAGHVVVSGGTLSAPAGITLSGSNTWSGGTINGSGVTVASGATLNLSGSGAILDGTTLTNNGTITLTSAAASALQLANAAKISNNGVVDVQSDGAITSDASATIFNSSGTVKKSAGTGTATIAGHFASAGSVLADAGTLAFTDFNQFAPGTTQLNGGGLKSASPMSFEGGKLLGGGKIEADVHLVTATLEPGRGVAPATLNVTGFVHQSGGVLIVDCFANGSSDKYVMGGVADIEVVRLLFFGGYEPANGDAFTNVISGSSYPAQSFYQYFPFGYNGTGRIRQTISSTSASYLAIIPSIDLSIGESVGAAAPSSTTYPVTVTFQKPDSDTSSSIQISLSATNGSIVSTASSTFACSGTGASATCAVAGLYAPTTATITVNVNVPSGNATLTATVAATEFDPNPANNTAAVFVPPIPVQADVSITQRAPRSATPGGTINYNFAVTNSGPSAAANVVVTDVTPPGLTLMAISGACSGFPCSLGTLVSGQTATLTVLYSVAANLTGVVNNTASVSSTTADPSLGNNTAQGVTTLTSTCPTATDAPVPSVAASAVSGQTYDVQWLAVDGATQYEIDEATDPSFTNPATQTVTTTLVSFAHTSSTAQTFYYRVRAFSACAQEFSAYSQTVQITVAPPARRRAVRR
jgi:uncharacterized repeat protein (TIGR01451 family)